MTMSLLFLPPGVNSDLIDLAGSNRTYEGLWRASVKAALMTHERERFLTMITRHRDALHALAAIDADPTALGEIIAIDNKEQSAHRPPWSEDPAFFCPIWKTLFHGKTGSAHDLLTLKTITQEDDFWRWGLKRAQRVNPNHNRAWVNRFIPHGLKEEKRRRKTAAQANRGRVYNAKP